jgi:osmotically-inducible protein OsmY
MYQTDEQIRQAVIDELEWEPEIRNASAIGVAADQGVVTLSGEVDSYWQKMAAEKAAKRVSGVNTVVQEIKIKLSGEFDDTDIARAVHSALDLNLSIPQGAVKAEVEDGWVTLGGEVEWLYQKTEAENSIEHLAGVKGVVNDITVTQPETPSGIKSNIERALKRMASVDSSRITVESLDGKVILRGTVQSWAERDEAERTACAAPGVREVDDRIAVAS